MPLTYSWPGPNALTTTTDARKALAGLIEADAAGNVRTGIFPSNTDPIISARADMNLDIAIFKGVTVQFGGPILIANDGVAQLPSNLVSPGAGTNYYVVYAKQNESTSPGTDANNNRIFGAQLSTTSFAVARAAMPAGALELGTVEMPTGKTATNDFGVVISATFQMTAAAGGVVLVRNSTELSAWSPHAGSTAYVLADESVRVWNGSRWLAFDTKPQTFTPTFNNFTPGNSVMQSTYTRRGMTVWCEGSVNVGSSSTIGNAPQLVLPFAGIAKYAASGTNYILGQVGLLDRGSNFYSGLVFTQASSAHVQLSALGASGAQASITPTSPFVWAVNDEFSWSFEYQIA